MKRTEMIEDLKTLKEFFEEQSGAYPLSLEYAIKELLEQPEIIRCKDCKHLFEDNKCPLRTWWTHTEDDFCSRAERRTDE